MQADKGKTERRRNKSRQKKRLSPPRTRDRSLAGEMKHFFICLPQFCVILYKKGSRQLVTKAGVSAGLREEQRAGASHQNNTKHGSSKHVIR